MKLNEGVLPYQRIIQDPLTITGIVMIALLLCIAFVGPSLAPHDPIDINMSDRLLGPSSTYPLGTDHLGRCMLSRLLHGAHITLKFSGWVVVSILSIGIPLGLISGYVGGKLDAIFMRIVDAVIAFPDIILAIAVVGLLGPSLTNIMVAIIAVRWISYARLVRGIVLSGKEKEYVMAARVGGAHPLRIMTKHLLPQAVPSVIVLATLDIGKIILAVSALSFLGLGAQPPLPEWGTMLNDGRPYFQTKPMLMILPGVAIMFVVLGFNLVGDGLRDILDPKGV